MWSKRWRRARVCACTRRALGNKDSFWKKSKWRGLKKKPSLPLLTWVRTAGWLWDVKWRREAQEYYVRSLLHTAHPTDSWQPLNVPLSSFQKDRKNLYREENVDEESKEKIHRCRFGKGVFVKTVREREAISVLCSCELTGYVCATVGVTMLLDLEKKL